MGSKSLFKSLLAAGIFFAHAAVAQNTSPFWSLAGNSNASSSSKLGTTNSIPLDLATNNATRIRIATDGKVGVGTTSPQQRFHVEGSSNQAIFVNTSALGITSGSGQIGYAKALPTGPGQRLGYFLVGSRGGAENSYNQAGMIGYAGGSWSSLSRPTYLAFETTPSGSAARVERLRIDASGNVGVGTTTPTAPLDVVNQNGDIGIRAYNSFIGADDNIALYAFSVNAPGYGYGVDAIGGYRGVRGIGQGSDYAGEVVGVYGLATGAASSGTRHGVHGNAVGGVTAFGVYGEGSNASSFNAAGYFAGNVYANNYYSISDRKFKNNIAPVEKALSQIMKLKPSTYQFKGDEYKGMHLPEGEQIGLIADEVKQVFPQLVKKAVQPAQYDEKDRSKKISPEVQYEAVNYQGLIPVVVASVQELKEENNQLQEVVEQQQQQIDELKAMVKKLVQGSGAVSLPNAYMGLITPNPVKGSASIRYSVPDGSNGQLLVFDAAGRQVKAISLKGAGTFNLDASTLASGVYTYSLIVSGKKVQTETMTVAR